MQDLQFSYHNAVSGEQVRRMQPAVQNAQQMLDNGTGKGNDFLGWLTLPRDIRPQLEEIQRTADSGPSVSIPARGTVRWFPIR